MSATRDKTQKVTFVYSNLYSIYRKGLEKAREGAVQEADATQPSLSGEALQHFVTGRKLDSGAVIKADSREAAAAQPLTSAVPMSPPRVSEYSPAQLLGKRVAKPAVLKEAEKTVTPVESLKQNLQQLNDLQARLRFMLKELEDLIKE